MAYFNYDYEQYHLTKEDARKKLKKYWYHAKKFLKRYGENNNLYIDFNRSATDAV